MCGIYLYAHNQFSQPNEYRKYPRISHSSRGPSGCKHLSIKNGNISAELHFDRLQINGDEKGMQPFELEGTYLMANAEIYNYIELAQKYGIKHEQLRSDCDIILYLYKKIGIDALIEQLDGEFAFIIYDRGIIHMARDRCGIKPLYYYYYENELACSSTVKALHMTPNHVVPGTILTCNLQKRITSNNTAVSMQIYHVFKYSPILSVDSKEHIALIYKKLYRSVEKRVLMHNNDVEVGFFLSGGLDSSITLSLAMEIYKKNNMLSESDSIHVFTFGFHKNAPDVLSAAKVVDYLKNKYGEKTIDWHLIICDLSTGIEALDDTIYNIETYDTTTVRASVPMYIMSQYVATKTNVKIIISGEGSDELFGGYLYFKYAPDEWAYRREILRLLSEIFIFDVQRAERCTASAGLELRPPFLDSELIDAVLSYKYLLPCEKNTKPLLRGVIELHNRDLLPDVILYGKKEALSDAVGYDWRAEVIKHANEAYEREELKYSENRAPHILEPSKEQSYYQYLYHKYIGGGTYLLPHLWLPRWVDTKGEPSATVLSVYSS